jgi:LysM repeat protein
LLSKIPAPDKEEYIVRPGDVLAKIAHKTKSTPEFIMRMNNLNTTMLRIGERLLISHPEFSLVIQRKAQLVVLLDKGAFFKQYHIQEVKLPPKQPARLTAKVAEIMAWNGGKRVGLGTKEYANSVRWIRIGAPGYILYSVPDGSHPNLDQPAPATGLGLAASDVNELSSLVNSHTPVTITE